MARQSKHYYEIDFEIHNRTSKLIEEALGNLRTDDSNVPILLSPKTVHPTARDDGKDLQDGDIYYNKTKQQIFSYDLPNKKWIPAADKDPSQREKLTAIPDNNDDITKGIEPFDVIDVVNGSDARYASYINLINNSSEAQWARFEPRDPTKDDDINSYPSQPKYSKWFNPLNGKLFMSKDDSDGNAIWTQINAPDKVNRADSAAELYKELDRDPTKYDDLDEGYKAGDVLYNTINGNRWYCVSAADDNAEWIPIVDEIPDRYDDSDLGYDKDDKVFVLEDGNIYKCEDNTNDNAIWRNLNKDIYPLPSYLGLYDDNPTKNIYNIDDSYKLVNGDTYTYFKEKKDADSTDIGPLKITYINNHWSVDGNPMFESNNYFFGYRTDEPTERDDGSELIIGDIVHIKGSSYLQEWDGTSWVPKTIDNCYYNEYGNYLGAFSYLPTENPCNPDNKELTIGDVAEIALSGSDAFNSLKVTYSYVEMRDKAWTIDAHNFGNGYQSAELVAISNSEPTTDSNGHSLEDSDFYLNQTEQQLYKYNKEINKWEKFPQPSTIVETKTYNYIVENDGDTVFAAENNTSKAITVLLDGYPLIETDDFTRDESNITLNNGATKNSQIYIVAYDVEV